MEVSSKTHITSQVLKWARETSGYSLKQIAKKLNQKKVSSQTILRWEKGKDAPTYSQLEKLAEYYKRPIAIFYFPSPPPEKNIAEDLNSLPKKMTETFPPNIRFLIRKALIKQINLSELYIDVIPIETQTFKKWIVSLNLNKPEKLVSKIIKETKNQPKSFFKLINQNTSIDYWRNVLENSGIWTFKEAFKNNAYRGFSLYHKTFPIIYINNSISREDQIFTMFHELGHILLKKGGITFAYDITHNLTGEYKNWEIFCNTFSNTFIDHSRNIENFSVKKQKNSLKIINVPKSSYYVTKRNYLGDKYIKLILSQYNNNKLNKDQVADYFDLNIKHLDPFEYFIQKQCLAK